MAHDKCTFIASLPPPVPSLLPSPSRLLKKKEGTFYYRNISGDEFIFITVLNKFQKLAAGENYSHYSFILIPKQKGCNCNHFAKDGIPFGSLVEYHPITAKDQSRNHQFGKKVLPGLFLGYVLYAGGIWKGDVLIADLEELETMDASEIYSKRLNAKEVIFPKEGEFIFPIADGRIKTPGGDQELRTSTLIRPRPIQGEVTLTFLENQKGLFHNLMTHFRMPVKR